MWTPALLALLTGVVITLVAARFTDGLGKQARLARASRELELAARFPEGDVLRHDLESIAWTRTAKYVATELPHVRIRRRTMLIIWGAVFIVLCAVVALVDLTWYAAIVLGAGTALFALKLNERLDVRFTPPPRPEPPATPAAPDPARD